MNRFSSLSLASCAVMLGLSACVVQVPQNPHATARSVPSDVVLSKTVAAGTMLTVSTGYSLNPDCTPAETVTMRITEPPVHGTAAVVHREGFPNYPASNPRSVCNVRRLPGVAIEYTPAAGFTGSDFFAYEAIAAGRDITTKVSIDVK